MRRLVLALALLLGVMGQGQSAWAQSGVGGGGQSNVGGGSSSSGAAGALSDASVYISSTCGTATNCFTATSGNAFFDCTYASASPTITCGASDVLTPFATGTWRVIVTCCGALGGQSKIGSALEAPAVTTVLSVNNAAHTITMNQNATVTRASVLGQSVVLVQDQTTIFQNAANAAFNVFGHCAPLQIGAGIYGVKQGFANAKNCANQITNNLTTGAGITGAGPGGRSGTTIVPLPDFDFTGGCTGQNSSCFFGIPGAIISNLAIWGGENSTTANSSTCGTNAKNIIDLTIDSLLSNVLIAGWCANDTALRAVKFDSVGQYCFYCIIDGAGGLNAEVVAGAHVYLSHSFFGDSNGVSNPEGGITANGAGLAIGGNAQVQTLDTGFGGQGTNSFAVVSAGRWYSTQDIWLDYFTVNNPFAALGSTSETHINQLVPSQDTPGSGSSAMFFLAAAGGGQLYVRDSRLTAGTANFALNCTAGTGRVIDEGGIVFANAFTTNCPAGQLLGSASITGTPLIATNVTPNTSWGTSGAAGNGVSAPLGDSHLFTFTITAAGVPAANPTLAVTFPTAYIVGGPAPQCSAKQIGGTGAIQQLTTTTGPSTTAVTFTWNGTPVAASTYVIQGSCGI